MPPRHKAQGVETIKSRAHGKRLFEDFYTLGSFTPRRKARKEQSSGSRRPPGDGLGGQRNSQ
jgi:hypothetical protein